MDLIVNKPQSQLLFKECVDFYRFLLPVQGNAWTVEEMVK
jgi:hypothetical protein